MIPLKDASRRPRNFPVVTLLLIVTNVLVFLKELDGGDAYLLRWALTPATVTSGHHPETLLTALFLHGEWLHLLGNMLFLWVFGPVIEDAMGSARYLAFYLLGGLAADAAQIAAAPNSTVLVLGASGAIAAVMGAFLVTFPGDRIRTVLFLGIFFTITRIHAALLIGLWFLLQVASAEGVLRTTQAGEGVGYFAHIGGFVFGMLLAHLFISPERVAEQTVIDMDS